MPQLQWKQLAKDEAHRVLTQLAVRADAVVFSKDYTTVSVAVLPFYPRHRLMRLVNYATMPTFTMLYLNADDSFIPLDGTANPIYTANEESPILLTPANAVAYLTFFLSHVQGSEGEALLIRDPSSSVFMRALSAEQRAHAGTRVRPPEVVADSAGNIRVRASIYYGHELIVSTIVVHPDGKISFHDQTQLLGSVFMPETIYAQARMEG